MANQEIFAFTFGLASACSWGTSDFTGGFVTKTSSVFGVLLVANITGTALLATCALVAGSAVPDLYSSLFAGLAGIAGLIGLSSLYKGLAVEHMGMVASVAAVISAAMPVLFGLIIEGRPSNQQIIGFAVAFVAIWYLSVSDKSNTLRWRQLKFPVASGLGFGLAFIFVDQAVSQSVLAPLIVMKVTGIVALITILKVLRIGAMPPRQRYPVVCLTGFFDAAGTALYASAAHVGRLDISAVVSSMHPAITAFLAWMILKERLSRRQWFGVAAALISLALIAA